MRAVFLFAVVVVLGSTVLFSWPAAAFGIDDDIPQSPQYGAFELKFGPYKPAIDDNPHLGDGQRPYKEIFNDDTMFLTVLELDWQFVHPPGFSLGIGGSIGFMQTYAKAALVDSDEESADYTVLNVMPFSALLVARVDALPDYLHFPLVPYFKIGFNWYLYWILKGGDTEIADGKKGRGGTLGWQFSPGLAIQLDGFDKKTARTFDNEIGVNHSYLFVEFLWAFVNRFGNGNVMNFSTDTFGNTTLMAGLALEF